MSSDPFTPDLNGLSNDYEILSDLRKSSTARAYLARHRKLNRDVTVTVVRAPASDRNALTHFASDARMLSVMRHRNVVPVIEGRWIPESGYAVVRARVRGTTLGDVIRGTGALPVTRVADTLEQVQSALEWARGNGIMNRGVASSAVVFQQGSDRVMIELEPSEGSGMPDACDDARTMGQLAFEMLSGQLGADADVALGEIRPDLTPAIVRETKLLMRCNEGDGVRDATALIGLLRGRLPSSVRVPRETEPANPTEASAEPPAPVKRPFAARLWSGLAVFLIATALGLGLLYRREHAVVPAAATPETTAVAGGDVLLPRQLQKSDTTPKRIAPTPAAATLAPRSTKSSRETERRDRRQVDLPETKRQESPFVPAPAPTHSRPVSPTLTLPGTVSLIPHDSNNPSSRDSGAGVTMSLDACDLPNPTSQQQCLISEVDRSDRALNNTYERLIGAMRHRSNAQANDVDPSSVDSLRRSQQRWAEARESTCRNVGSGPLFARVRAQCYADIGAKRASDLSSHLASIPGTPKDTMRR